MVAYPVVDPAGKPERVGLVSLDLCGQLPDEGGEADVGILLGGIFFQLGGCQPLPGGDAGGCVVGQIHILCPVDKGETHPVGRPGLAGHLHEGGAVDGAGQGHGVGGGDQPDVLPGLGGAGHRVGEPQAQCLPRPLGVRLQPDPLLHLIPIGKASLGLHGQDGLKTPLVASGAT